LVAVALRFLVIQKDDLALAEPQRLGFEPGIDLGVDRTKDSFLKGGCDDDVPMFRASMRRRGLRGCAPTRRQVRAF